MGMLRNLQPGLPGQNHIVVCAGGGFVGALQDGQSVFPGKQRDIMGIRVRRLLDEKREEVLGITRGGYYA